MVEIVNTQCSWVVTRCADKSTAEYTKYIYIAISPPPTHTHARTHKQMHARTHTSWTSVPSAFLSYLTYLIPSFRCNTLSIHRSTPAVVSINSLERDGLRQAEFCPCYIMDNRPNFGFLVHKDMGSLGLPTSLQQTNLNPLENSSFQCHHHTDLCTNIWT